MGPAVTREVFHTSHTGTFVRAEFPQPQFERRDWLSLNGTWEFAFDEANVGLRERWHSRPQALGRSIEVPFCPESEASGVNEAGMHHVCWYRRTFEAPASWETRRVVLRFGAVDYRAQVWVNGECCGSHEGGQTPFSFDVTAYMQPGTNVVTVRAEDLPRDRSLPRGKQYWKEQPEFIWYTRTTGIWQPVWLEAMGERYLEQVKITPTLDGAVRFEVQLDGWADDLEFRAGIREWGSTAELASAWADLTSADRAETTAMVPFPRLWSPEHPNLYQVTYELRRDGEVLDRVESYFGFRTVEMVDGVVHLNHVPTMLKLVLDQGYWPETMMTPPSDEAMQFDIQAAKELGFNGIRKHQKAEDPRFLYWCDRMGLLVSAEIGNAYDFTATSVARLTQEWTELVQRDWNHPSIIIWVPLNESWGTPELQKDRRQVDFLRTLYLLTKSLDPSRLVIDNDGWEHSDCTDLFALHDYAKTGEQLAARYADTEPGPCPFPDVAYPNLAVGAKYNGSPLYISEFGGVGYLPAGEAKPAGAWGYDGLEQEGRPALARIQGLLEAAMMLPRSAGFCYTQLYDVEAEINGLLTYDRRWKFPAVEIRQSMELLMRVGG